MMPMLAAIALGAAGMRAQTTAPRGFTADAAVAQLEREQRLRAVANRDRIREYAPWAFASVSTTADRALRAREADLAAVNRLLLSVERLWADDKGLPGRPWFRHLLYAPGLYTGYAVKTLPGIREAIEQRRWAEAARQLTSATAAVKRVTTRLKETSARLREVTRGDASGSVEPIVRR